MTPTNIPEITAPENHSSSRPMPQVPCLLRDLKLPDDVQKEVVEIWTRTRCRKEWQKREVEEAVKRGYFFGGKAIAELHTPQGMLILVAGDLDSAEFSAALAALPPEQRRKKVLAYGFPWDTSREDNCSELDGSP